MDLTRTGGDTLARRTLLRGAVVGGVALAGGVIAATADADPGDTPVGQVPGVATAIDTSHATPEVTRLLSGLFRDKTRADVEATMSHFSRQQLAYLDGTLGLSFLGWQALHDLFAYVMPNWGPQVKSYPVRILGDATSALVFFVDTPGAFGPSEIRAAGVINFTGGKITREVDYWDGRHFGRANLKGLQLPPDKFPTDFRESTVGETASPVIRDVARRLNQALAQGDTQAATDLFADDAVLEDVPAHVQLLGPAAIGGYLHRAPHLLAYTGTGVAVRHVVGSASGGGYEWRSEGIVPRGATALELDREQRITRLTAIWDGSLLGDQDIADLQRPSIES
jgi:ketosteroid isomerase-like protein